MKILIIDDHALFREGLRSLFRVLDPEIEIDEAKDCDDAVAKAPDQTYDVVLLDLKLPGVGGLDGLHRIREHYASSRVVILSGEDDPQTVRSTIEKGALGFIPKSTTSDVLIHALKLVIAGGVYLPVQAILAPPHQQTSVPQDSRDPATRLDGLSPRHLEVLRAVIHGKANKVIARELGITEATVKAHVSSVLRALGVRNRTEAVYAAAKHGITIF